MQLDKFSELNFLNFLKICSFYVQPLFSRQKNWSFQYNVYSGIELITITPSAFEESFTKRFSR